MTGMWDLMLGTTPSTIFSILVAILASYVGKHIHEVTIAMAALGDVKGDAIREGAEVSMQ